MDRLQELLQLTHQVIECRAKDGVGPTVGEADANVEIYLIVLGLFESPRG